MWHFNYFTMDKRRCISQHTLKVSDNARGFWEISFLNSLDRWKCSIISREKRASPAKSCFSPNTTQLMLTLWLIFRFSAGCKRTKWTDSPRYFEADTKSHKWMNNFMDIASSAHTKTIIIVCACACVWAANIYSDMCLFKSNSYWMTKANTTDGKTPSNPNQFNSIQLRSVFYNRQIGG